MREIIKMGEQLQSRMLEEVETMLAERTMLRDVVVARGRELQAKRDEEIRRIDRWAQSQKEIVKEVFQALLAENDLDIEKHEIAIHRLDNEAPAAKLQIAPKIQQMHRTAAE